MSLAAPKRKKAIANVPLFTVARPGSAGRAIFPKPAVRCVGCCGKSFKFYVQTTDTGAKMCRSGLLVARDHGVTAVKRRQRRWRRSKVSGAAVFGGGRQASHNLYVMAHNI